MADLISSDDAIWILTSTFIIFTMQSGFGLLESGSITIKNQANVMMKNVVDVVVGGLSYWMLGYGMSYGNSFIGIIGTNNFFLNYEDAELDEMGDGYAHFFFQSSFAATATTIVSGAVAERVNFVAYIIFTFFNSFIYAVPCHWIWNENGFLAKMGAFDFAGSGAVHLLGGVTGLVGAVIVGPRMNRWKQPHKYTMSCPSNVILGLFFLWWGWIGFNCGSVYGIAGDKWVLATKSAVTTMRGATGGGIVGLIMTWAIQKKTFDVSWLANGVLGGLVGVTSFCMAVSPWESMIVGGVGAAAAIGTDLLLRKLKVDDPVGAVGVHAGAGVWSLIAVGFFAQEDESSEALLGMSGLFHGGDFTLLAVQLLYIVCLIAWTSLTTFIAMKAIDLTIGMRCDVIQEVFGADLVEHRIGGAFNYANRELFLENGNFLTYIPMEATEYQIVEYYKYFQREQGEQEFNQLQPGKEPQNGEAVAGASEEKKGGLFDELKSKVVRPFVKDSSNVPVFHSK